MNLRDVLRDKASPLQESNVDALLKYGKSILSLVRDTFPTYTLHNEVHAENVIAIMEGLLGEAISKVTALEAAMLLTAAYFHDAGMVFTDDERASLPEIETFTEYLKSHPADDLLFMKSDRTITEEIAESYCRWIHAERVSVILDRVPQDLLMWGNVSIKYHLAEMCRSHNLSVENLKASTFDELFLDECDLRFCAILLRLADILDFDHSRSPDPVYELLGISNRLTPRTQQSDVEWRKHLCSDGFKFPTSRHEGYTLGFAAGPDEPAVEHDLQEFLNVIEVEMAACRGILPFTTTRWSTHHLPSKVNRKNIISNGYIFGDFRFKLDRAAILSLFMGENLYTSREVFLREILQNSIDAVRARSTLEDRAPELGGYKIVVSDWVDSEGYQWIRIDDDGCGMSLDVINNYFFRIGASYYSSPEFKAELARHGSAAAQTMTPVSRFGVGILSAFMVADRIELTTRKNASDDGGGHPLRVSLHRMTDYFTVQTPPHVAALMPARTRTSADTSGYRSFNKPGTSIAIRIDPSKQDNIGDVTELCRTFLMASPVAISVNQVALPVAKPYPPRKRRVFGLPWDREEFAASELHEDLIAALTEVRVEFVPLDFDTAGGRPEVKGGGFVMEVDASSVRKWMQEAPLNHFPGFGDVPTMFLDEELKNRLRTGLEVEIDSSEKELAISVHIYGQRRYSSSEGALDKFKHIGQEDPDMAFVYRLAQYERDDRFSFSSSANNLLLQLGWPEESARHSAKWSHNGVTLPTPTGRMGGTPWSLFVQKDEAHFMIGAVFGSFWLQDALRPNLNIARDKIQSLPFETISALELTLRQSLRASSAAWAENLMISGNVRLEHPGAFSNMPPPTLGDIAVDPLVTSPNGWCVESLFRVDDHVQLVSIEDIKALLAKGNSPVVDMVYSHSESAFWWDLRMALLALNFELRTNVVRASSQVLIRGLREAPIIDKRLFLYPPGTFLSYGSADYLFMESSSFPYAKKPSANFDHSFTQWFLTAGPFLKNQAPALERRIFRLLDAPGKDLKDHMAALREAVAALDRLGHGSLAPYGLPLDDSLIQDVTSSKAFIPRKKGVL